jgi:hypothetical protein
MLLPTMCKLQMIKPDELALHHFARTTSPRLQTLPQTFSVLQYAEGLFDLFYFIGGC